MKIAIVGCLHGELDKVYRDIAAEESKNGYKVDLVLVCGDFQSVRNQFDLRCMAVPRKFQVLGDFHKYYFGEKVAPILTIFIGGNHEASNYLSSLPFGGWVADNIYYLGYASVVRFNGLRICGVSGIYKKHDANLGHYEKLPYDNGSMRSVYHTRCLNVHRLMCLGYDIAAPIDIVLSHDWPLNIHTCGDVDLLLRKKPYFAEDINRNFLGNPLYEPLFKHLKPKYWFSAHLHVYFEAYVKHSEEEDTKFMALDKCLPRRKYFHILDMETGISDNVLQYDPEWVCVLKQTDALLSISKETNKKVPSLAMPCSHPTQDDIKKVVEDVASDLNVPLNFSRIEPVLDIKDTDPRRVMNYVNPQTTEFCVKFNLTDPVASIIKFNAPKLDPHEIALDDEDEDEEEDIAGSEIPLEKKFKPDTTDELNVNSSDLFFIDKIGDIGLRSDVATIDISSIDEQVARSSEHINVISTEETASKMNQCVIDLSIDEETGRSGEVIEISTDDQNGTNNNVNDISDSPVENLCKIEKRALKRKLRKQSLNKNKLSGPITIHDPQRQLSRRLRVLGENTFKQSPDDCDGILARLLWTKSHLKNKVATDEEIQVITRSSLAIKPDEKSYFLTTLL